MTEATHRGGAGGGGGSNNSDSTPGDAASGSSNFFECNICLESPKDPVVSMCGHLFCWPCIHQWLETRPDRKTCPVCKAAIDRDKCVPLYGRGGSENVDPRNKPIPPRPQARRTEPEPQPGFNPFGGLGFADFPGGGMNPGGFHVSFGIGAFPFFGTFFNLNTGPGGNQQMEHDNSLGNLFLIITVLIILYMLLL